MPRLIPSPLHDRPMSVAHVLRALAAQEGCDGAPWDQMRAASEYIEELEGDRGELVSLLSEAAELIDPGFKGAGVTLGLIRELLVKLNSPEDSGPHHP